jgi:hypothetical protein
MAILSCIWKRTSGGGSVTISTRPLYLAVFKIVLYVFSSDVGFNDIVILSRDKLLLNIVIYLNEEGV